MSNKKQFNKWLQITILTISVITFIGCTAIATHPLASPPGGTITLAVGTPDDMTSENTSVFFTPNGGTQFELDIRSIFKLYPDNNSLVWLENGTAQSIEDQTGHGPWTTIMAIDIPNTLPDLSPIPIGPGIISVNTTTSYPPLTTHINNIPINLEILGGTGIPNPFRYELLNGIRVDGNLADLEPMSRLIVKPDYTGAGSSTYGAIEVTITIPGMESSPEGDFHVVIDKKIGHDNTRRSQFFWSKPGADIYIMLINPTETLQYYDAHFSIMSVGLTFLLQQGLITTEDITITTTYYNENGQVVSGPALNAIDAT